MQLIYLCAFYISTLYFKRTLVLLRQFIRYFKIYGLSYLWGKWNAMNVMFILIIRKLKIVVKYLWTSHVEKFNYQLCIIKKRLFQFLHCSKQKKIIIGANSIPSAITPVFCYLWWWGLIMRVLYFYYWCLFPSLFFVFICTWCIWESYIFKLFYATLGICVPHNFFSFLLVGW